MTEPEPAPWYRHWRFWHAVLPELLLLPPLAILGYVFGQGAEHHQPWLVVWSIVGLWCLILSWLLGVTRKR